MCVLSELGLATPIAWTTVEELAEHNRKDLVVLAAQFGWELDEETGQPLRPPVVFDDLTGLHSMAAVMHAAGAFSSIGEAKRNGWNRPIEPGKFTSGKGMNQRVAIVAAQPAEI